MTSDWKPTHEMELLAKETYHSYGLGAMYFTLIAVQRPIAAEALKGFAKELDGMSVSGMLEAIRATIDKEPTSK